MTDAFVEIDGLMATMHSEEAASSQAQQASADAADEFAAAFSVACTGHVRPVMDAAVARLQANGGGGLVVDTAEDRSRMIHHRLTLWMSLRGPIHGAPRPDRHPYLQLDADVGHRTVVVSEGDMWDGLGGNRSGRVAEWPLAEMTADAVTVEILGVLRRAFRAGKPAPKVTR